MAYIYGSPQFNDVVLNRRNTRNDCKTNKVSRVLAEGRALSHRVEHAALLVLRRLIRGEEDAEWLLQLVAAKVFLDLRNLLGPSLKGDLPFSSSPGLLLF